MEISTFIVILYITIGIGRYINFIIKESNKLHNDEYGNPVKLPFFSQGIINNISMIIIIFMVGLIHTTIWPIFAIKKIVKMFKI